MFFFFFVFQGHLGKTKPSNHFTVMFHVLRCINHINPYNSEDLDFS